MPIETDPAKFGNDTNTLLLKAAKALQTLAAGGSFNPASPGPIGNTTPGTGAFTTLAYVSAVAAPTGSTTGLLITGATGYTGKLLSLGTADGGADLFFVDASGICTAPNGFISPAGVGVEINQQQGFFSDGNNGVDIAFGVTGQYLATFASNGNVAFPGTASATTFSGSGANLTGVTKAGVAGTLYAGTATLTSGTVDVTISGMTSSGFAVAGFSGGSPAITTADYKVVCGTGKITISAAAVGGGLVNTDASVVSYFAFKV